MFSILLKLLMAVLVLQNSLGSCSSEEQDPFNVAEQESVVSAIAEASQKFANNVQRSLLGRRLSAPEKDTLGFTNVKLGDSKITDNRGTTTTVTNVAITVMSPVYLMHFNPDIQNRIADVRAYWSQIVLGVTYENSAMPNVTSNLIVSNNGNLLEGKVGLQVNGSHFEVSNSRLNVIGGSIYFWNITSDNEKKDVSYMRYDEAVGQIFRNYFYFDIRALLEKILKRSINELLQNYQVSDIFNNSPQVQRSFRSLAAQRDESVNQLIDLVLYVYRQYMIQEGKTHIQAPDINTTFQETIFGVPLLGYLKVNNGSVGDLSTIYRTGSFSIDGVLTDSEFTLFGSLGLSDLQATYNHYQVDIMTFHPSGSLSATVGSNSIYFELTGNLKGLGSLTVKKYDIRVQELDNIKVQLTGMGEALDWLLSKVINWAIDTYKPQLVESVQNNLRNIIDKQLNKMGWEIPLSR